MDHLKRYEANVFIGMTGQDAAFSVTRWKKVAQFLQ